MHATVKTDSVRYEFDEHPDIGETMQIAPGLFWLRMYLPFSLSHINLWLLEDGDGWSIVDTGVNIDECRDIWTKTLNGRMKDHPP